MYLCACCKAYFREVRVLFACTPTMDMKCVVYLQLLAEWFVLQKQRSFRLTCERVTRQLWMQGSHLIWYINIMHLASWKWNRCTRIEYQFFCVVFLVFISVSIPCFVTLFQHTECFLRDAFGQFLNISLVPLVHSLHYFSFLRLDTQGSLKMVITHDLSQQFSNACCASTVHHHQT